MADLVKEGLLKRAPRVGTFVANRTDALTHVGIYLAEDVWRRPESAYDRAVVASLNEQLSAEGITPAMWVDCRTEQERSKPWPEMVRAAEQRQFQAIIIAGPTAETRSWVERLPVPTPDPDLLDFDYDGAGRMVVAELVKQGCKSIGVIVSHTAGDCDSGRRDPLLPGDWPIAKAAKELGVQARQEWMLHPGAQGVPEQEAEHWGYEAMHRLLAMPQRPEGVYVRHDWVARGAITAMLEEHVRVPQDLKLVLWRNAELGLPCPMPVAFLDWSVTQKARTMIGTMKAKVRGEEVEAVRIMPTISHIRSLPARPRRHAVTVKL